MKVESIMSEHVFQERPAARLASTWVRKAAPAAVLIILAPILAELLMGATRISRLWLLVPEMGVYGVGALLIREVVRRQRRGWGSILLLGIAFAILEEAVILQTSLTPQFFGAAGANSVGWAFGVQWLYLLAMLVYESVYAIVIPIQLVELLFPTSRDERWLTDLGMAAAGVVFLFASTGVHFLWTRGGLQNLGAAGYQPPWTHAVLALLAAAALVAVTLGVPPRGRPVPRTPRRARSPWLAGLLGFIFGLFWWLLVIFAYLDRSMVRGLSPLAPLAAGVAWAGLAYLAVRRLASAEGWQDIHRLALIFGALLASMLGGTVSLITASPADRLGKLVLDVVAVILLSAFAWRLRRRSPESAHPA
jgi:hypothetical protein